MECLRNVWNPVTVNHSRSLAAKHLMEMAQETKTCNISAGMYREATHHFGRIFIEGCHVPHRLLHGLRVTFSHAIGATYNAHSQRLGQEQYITRFTPHIGVDLARIDDSRNR